MDSHRGCELSEDVAAAGVGTDQATGTRAQRIPTAVFQDSCQVLAVPQERRDCLVGLLVPEVEGSMNPTITNERPRPPSITAPLIQKNKETDFLTAATAAIDRGFAVTPVSPFKKCGVLSRWQVHPGKTQSEINQYAKDYPHYNVGVVSRRGVGNLMFLDIDSEGVLEQIEAETGHQLPLTYSVQSRPQSAPWKRHLYFKQTRYSYDAFGRDKSREINVNSSRLARRLGC